MPGLPRGEGAERSEVDEEWRYLADQQAGSIQMQHSFFLTGLHIYQLDFAVSRQPAFGCQLELWNHLPEASKKVEAGTEETLTYCDFPSEHWTKIRTNTAIERLNREIRRRTRVVGAFPDGNSARMLVCARLRHVVGTQWGSKKYMNMKHLEAMETETTAVQ